MVDGGVGGSVGAKEGEDIGGIEGSSVGLREGDIGAREGGVLVGRSVGRVNS